MKEIALTKGLSTKVDDEDFDFLNQWKWYAQKAGKNHYYAARNRRILDSNDDDQPRVILMHRILLKSEVLVDHEDLDSLNNQKYNLRKATHSQNIANKPSRGKSKYLGVYKFISKYKKKEYHYWVAQLCKDYKRTSLGYFKIEEDAARAYDKAAKELHGEFANLNFK